MQWVAASRFQTLLTSSVILSRLMSSFLNFINFVLQLPYILLLFVGG